MAQAYEHTIEVTLYEYGTEPHIDEVLIPTEICWIIKGPRGALPVIAATEAEARERYNANIRPLSFA